MNLRNEFSKRRWRIRLAAQRWKRAIAYGRDRLSREDAHRVLYDVQMPAGYFPLTGLSVDHILEDLSAYDLEPHPELERLITDGCARVASKWDDAGDSIYYAETWAIDLAKEYAAREGIVLVDRGDDEEGAAA